MSLGNLSSFYSADHSEKTVMMRLGGYYYFSECELDRLDRYWYWDILHCFITL